MGQFITTHEEISNAGRGPSHELWGDCPRDEIKNDFSAGWYFEDDFMNGIGTTDSARYAITNATAGTFLMDDAQGGVALADSASTDATKGINVQLADGSTGERFIPVANSDIWFEARVKAADMATGPQFFLGLSEISETILASSLNTSANHIGFESVSDNGVLLIQGEKAGTRNSALDSPHTLVDDTYVKLGFKVTGVTKVEFYVDGVVKATQLATANIPILALTPSLVCQSGGTTDPIVHIDWWAAYQEYRL